MSERNIKWLGFSASAKCSRYDDVDIVPYRSLKISVASVKCSEFAEIVLKTDCCHSGWCTILFVGNGMKLSNNFKRAETMSLNGSTNNLHVSSLNACPDKMSLISTPSYSRSLFIWRSAKSELFMERAGRNILCSFRPHVRLNLFVVFVFKYVTAEFNASLGWRIPLIMITFVEQW